MKRLTVALSQESVRDLAVCLAALALEHDGMPTIIPIRYGVSEALRRFADEARRQHPNLR